MATIGELLLATLSHDGALREGATKQLETAEQENFAAYVLALSQEIANENADVNIRVAAGLALKNTLSAREQAKKDAQAQRWTMLDAPTKGQMKSALLMALASPQIRSGSVAAQVIASVAALEIPRGEWTDLITVLLNNVTTDQPNLKLASLQTIGYICESIEPELLAQQSNQILTAVVQGARKEEPNDHVRLAALQALYNSLEFIKDNFEREGERNYIMQVVCEATQSQDVHVQISAFENLVRIMQLYYDKMKFYMEKALFGLTIMGMKNQNEKVALQAVEFWSTVCDVELDLQAEEEYDEVAESQNQGFALAAIGELVPVLLYLLTQREEEEDEDEWNLSMAAATCLSLLANCVRDPIVAPVTPFVSAHIRSPDWRYREAAVMAFGSILEGPDPTNLLKPLVEQALPLLLELMRDPVLSVKDTTSWTLGRICDVVPEPLKATDVLHVVISAIINGLAESPRVASNCCWCLISLSEHLAADDDNAATYKLSPFFDSIVTALMQSTERPGAEINFRATAHEAISMMVSNCARDCYGTVDKLLDAVMQRLDASVALQSQIVNSDDRNAYNEMQANLCSVMTSCIRRLKGNVAVKADTVMAVLLKVMEAAAKSSTVLEDAFLTVGAVTAAVEADFVRYMERFTPILYQALSNHEEHQMCGIAVGIVGDICRALNEAVQPFCDSFMNLLLQNLQSPVLHRNVKPAILSCFGDIALAIGGKFEPYLEFVMIVLQQATQLKAPRNNYDMIDYVNQLREGIFEAYVGITQGLKSGEKAYLLQPHVDHIFQFLEVVYQEDDRPDALSRAMIGLLGDLAEAFTHGELKGYFQRPWIEQLIKQGKSARGASASIKEVARWSASVIAKHMKSS